jgi:hypothetical protein
MRFVPLAIQMLLLVAPLYADDPLTALVGPASAVKLRSDGQITANVPSNGSLFLLPAIGSRDGIVADLSSAPVTAGVEYVRLLSSPGGAPDGESAWLALFNNMHAVSTMQGITYYSASRGRERVLFTQSWTVASAADTRRIPDPLSTSIPHDDVLYTFQEDSSFGRNTYKDTFAFAGDHLHVKVENLSTITFLLMPLIQPGGFVSHIVLAPAGDRILFYGVSYVRMYLAIGDRGSRDASLKNRMIAMASWLEARISAGGKTVGP